MNNLICQMRKAARLLIVAAIFVFSLLAWGAADSRPGLTVEHGVLIKDGQPYHGVGVNYFNAFLRTVLQPTNTTYREGFAILGQHKIPFARFAACGFWPADWKLYQTNQTLYFKQMDKVVQAAEENQVGLIPSLFWRVGTLCELAGEPHRAWGEPASKTHELMRRYTEEVVTRYRNSPAIWGWEFANEFSLEVDLPNAKQLLEKHKAIPRLGVPQGTEADLLSATMMITALQEFAKTVRKFDPHRIIISGNSIPRPGAWHNAAEKSWTTDSREQFMQILVRDNPDPVSTICVHVYPAKEKRFSKEQPASQLDVLRAIMSASQQARKPLFVGEFGASKELGPEAERTTFTALLADLQKAGVPLAALWVFDLPTQNKDWNVTATNERAYMLKLVAEANARTR